VRATFRPLPAWPYPEQPKRPATFKVTYSRTLQDLEREIEALRGRELIIGVVVDENAIRIDGQMRADAKVRHSGVEVSFEVPDGRRLVFHTDVHGGYTTSWQDNLRAIARGLEALRAVARYGITSGVGEQYAGFAQLSAGGPDPVRGKALVDAAGSVKEALYLHHPDHGGRERDFVDVDAYRKTVGA
jgi:hypothetical protein